MLDCYAVTHVTEIEKGFVTSIDERRMIMKRMFGILICVPLLLVGCAEGGGMYSSDKEFSIMRTLGAVAAGALAVGAAQECSQPGANCFQGLGQRTSYTGGPNYDWDIFSNGQYRCRDISTGQFAYNSLCSGMPVDDDRWPNS
jgi:hypothetical protein